MLTSTPDAPAPAGPGPERARGRGLMSRIYPFSTLPNPTEVWAWGMYDLANQSFTLLIVTLLFPLYFEHVIVGNATPEDAARGHSLWSAAGASSLALVVLLSPLLGAVGDCRRSKKRLLIGTGVVCAALTVGLAWTGPGDVALAMATFIIANAMFQLGGNFMASFLPTLATPRNIGRVSAIGWTMGYLGGLIVLGVVIAAMFALKLDQTEEWRPFFVLAGLWFAVNMIPTAVVLREPPGRPLPGDADWLVVAAFRRLADTVRHAVRFRQLFLFLVAFAVFMGGVQVTIKFASILASDFGIRGTGLAVFVGQLTVTAMVTAALTARFQDRIGARTTVFLYIGVWLASTLALVVVTVLVPVSPPQWLFWVIGNGIGIGLGGIGTASRALVGKFSPAARTSEFFGLWGMTYNLAGVIGVLTFGQVKAWIGLWWSRHGTFGNENTPALVVLAAFFLVGGLLLLRVSETAGLRAARRADRDAGSDTNTLPG